MTNLECAVAVLAKHREARKWTDEAVAHDLLKQLGLDGADDARNAVAPVDPLVITEAEVLAAEAAAEEAADKARAARTALDAQAGALPVPDGPAVHDGETRTYSDGTSATGVPPLPDQSPAQQAAPAFVPPVTHVEPPFEPAPLIHAEPVPPHA